MAVLTLQPDATAGIDTSIVDNANFNYGISGELQVGNVGVADWRSLLQFDLSSIPASAVITSAIITLYVTAEASTTDYNVDIHRGLVQWYEGFKDNAAPDGGQDGSTWLYRNYNGSIAWGANGGLAGTDYVSAASASVSITGPLTTFDFNVLSDVQNIISGAVTNYGWWLLPTAIVSSSKKNFASSDNTTAANRPKLTVIYTVLTGVAAGSSTASATAALQNMAGSAAGLAAASGHMAADGFLQASSIAGAATVSGTLPVQEMSGSAAGLALVSGEALALLTYQQPIWKAFIDGVEHALNGGSPFWRIQATGIGLPPVRNIKQRGPSQHGSTRRTFRYDERILNLAYIFSAPNPTTADLWRDQAAAIFAPLEDDEMIVEVTRTDGTLRRIRASLVGLLDFPDTPLDDRIGFSQRFVAQLECADPIWYDPELRNLVFTATAGGSAGWQIPMQIPWVQQSGDAIDQTETVHYTGRHKAFPQIVVTGPAQGLEITNQETGLKVKLKDDVVIAAGDVWTFDLRYGAKTVKDINGVLHNGDLHNSSSIGQWALEPNPKAPGGVNNIRVQIPSAATVDTRLQMLYYDRFAHL